MEGKYSGVVVSMSGFDLKLGSSQGCEPLKIFFSCVPPLPPSSTTRPPPPPCPQQIAQIGQHLPKHWSKWTHPTLQAVKFCWWRNQCNPPLLQQEIIIIIPTFPKNQPIYFGFCVNILRKLGENTPRNQVIKTKKS